MVHIEARLPINAARAYAVLGNLRVHRGPDVLLCSLARPHSAFVFHPLYTAYLNLIAAWWKSLPSLALVEPRAQWRSL